MLMFQAPPHCYLAIATRDKTSVAVQLLPLLGFGVDLTSREVSAIPIITPQHKAGTFRAAVLWVDGKVYERDDVNPPRIFDSVEDWTATIRVLLGVKPDMMQDPPIDQEPAGLDPNSTARSLEEIGAAVNGTGSADPDPAPPMTAAQAEAVVVKPKPRRAAAVKPAPVPEAEPAASHGLPAGIAPLDPGIPPLGPSVRGEADDEPDQDLSDLI